MCVCFHMCGGLKLTPDTFLDYFPFYLIEAKLCSAPRSKDSGCLASELVPGIPLCWIYRQSHTFLALCGFWESKLWSSHLNSKHFIHWAVSWAWHTTIFDWIFFYRFVRHIGPQFPSSPPPHSCLPPSFLLYFLVFMRISWPVPSSWKFRKSLTLFTHSLSSRILLLTLGWLFWILSELAPKFLLLWGWILVAYVHIFHDLCSLALVFGRLRKKYISGLSVWLQEVKAFLGQALSLTALHLGLWLLLLILAELAHGYDSVCNWRLVSQSSVGANPVWSLPHSELK